MQELAARRQRYARTMFRLALVFVVMTAGLLGLVVLLSRQDLSAAPLPNTVGCLLMGIGALILTGASLADAKQADRYAGGDLVVRSDPRRLGLYLTGHVMQTVAGVLIAYGLGRILGGDAWLFGAILGFCVIGVVVNATFILARGFRSAPILTVTRDGLFAPDAMRRPVTWAELESIPVAPSAPQYLLTLKTQTRDDNRASFLTRPLGNKATHLIVGRGADTSQTDVLLAIAQFRPDLVAALTLPKVTGFKAAISPARTI